MKQYKRATIKDIAKEAGVSIATVSFALNGHNSIPDKTKRKIIRIAKQFNYVPNEVAQSLVNKNTHYCGFILPIINDTFFSDILESSYNFLEERGFSLFTYLTWGIGKREVEGVESLVKKDVRGVIIFSLFSTVKSFKKLQHIKDLEDRHIPYVLIDRDIPNGSHNFVGVDNFKGGRLLAEHLIELGHRRFVFIYGEECPPIWERYNGFESVIKQYDGTSIKKIKCPRKVGVDTGYEGAKSLLAGNRRRYTAIFSASDSIAWGALKALHENKVKVPDDISVVGFDDLYISSILTPPLTTIYYNRQQIGEFASKILLESIENPNRKKTRRVIIEPKLIVRESTKKVISDES